VSAPVAGSLPLDLRYGGSVGDGEQMLPAIYNSIAGYRDLYMLGAYGYRRKHIQILNQTDSCCFSDLQWTDPGGLDRAINAYQSDIQFKILSALTGWFEVARYSDNGGVHKISLNALTRIYKEIDGMRPVSSPLFFYDSRGGGATSLLQSNGRYSYVETLTGFAKDWSDVVATRNGHLFFYRRSDGRAATAALLNDGTYRISVSRTMSVPAGPT